ncbi:lysophospholipid acyltransferase family protein [Nanoarchaeota archaeon]
MVNIVLRSILAILVRPFIKEIKGLENVPKKGPYIIAANHKSFSDGVIVPYVISTLSEWKSHFYVNDRFMKHFILKNILKYFQTIPVRVRGDNKHKVNQRALKLATNYINKGEVIGIFPEGKIVKDNKLAEFKPGAATLAYKLKIKVVPLGVIGTEKIIPKGSWIIRPRRCKLKFGKPIKVKNVQQGTRKIKKEIERLILP